MAGALLMVAALIFWPYGVLAGEPGIYQTPFVPQAVLEADPVAGQTIITTTVWTGTRWAQQSFVVVPSESMAAECVSVPRPQA